MARQRNIIPIHLGLNKSVEEVGLSNSSAALYDCVIDVEGDNAVVNRRPCLKTFVDTGENASVDGIFWWEEQQKMVVICNGKTITIDDAEAYGLPSSANACMANDSRCACHRGDTLLQ